MTFSSCPISPLRASSVCETFEHDSHFREVVPTETVDLGGLATLKNMNSYESFVLCSAISHEHQFSQ